jgi:exosortase
MRVQILTVAGAAAAVLLWAYWSSYREVAHKWEREPQYSHGYLVPVFALMLAWLRRKPYLAGPFTPSSWGLVVLAGAMALRLLAGYFSFDWPDWFSLLPTLAGVCLLAGGWRALHWWAPSIAFLIFMIPLPYRLEIALGQPLQRMATVMSTFLLQTLGLPALAEGNTIILNEVTLGVVEACSGLRMLVVFFAISTAVALVLHKGIGVKLVIVASAVPIALVTNVVRITATGVLHVYAGSAIANAVFHDLAGWLMMPFALVLLWLELWVIAHLFVEEPDGDLPPLLT